MAARQVSTIPARDTANGKPVTKRQLKKLHTWDENTPQHHFFQKRTIKQILKKLQTKSHRRELIRSGPVCTQRYGIDCGHQKEASLKTCSALTQRIRNANTRTEPLRRAEQR